MKIKGIFEELYEYNFTAYFLKLSSLKKKKKCCKKYKKRMYYCDDCPKRAI